MAVCAEDRISQFGGILFNTVKNGSIVMRNEIGYNYSYNMRRLLAKALSERVWSVVPQLGKFHNFFPHIIANLMATMQRPRHCRDADTQFLGKVL